MIIVRCPFRVGLFGGGLDFPNVFKNEPLKILGCSIEQSCYVGINLFSQDKGYNYRLIYKAIEEAKDVNEIKHPLIKQVLKNYEIKSVEIHYNADLASNSGLGSSSAFANALIFGFEKIINKKEVDLISIINKSIYLERKELGEAGGIQDQVFTALSGINLLEIKNSDWSVKKLCQPKYTEFIQNHAVLIPVNNALRAYYGIDIQSNVLKDKMLNKYRTSLIKITAKGINAFMDLDLEAVAYYTLKSWKLKSQLQGVINSEILTMEKKLLDRGALGLRLIGAGGGGFFIVWGTKDFVSEIRDDPKLNALNINISNTGVAEMSVNL